jgi:multidrug resistance protein
MVSSGLLPAKAHKREQGVQVNLIAVPDGASTPGTASPPNEPVSKFELVTWNGPHDPENPQNWARRKKLLRSFAPLAVIFSISFCSSIFGSATSVTAHQYGVSEEVMSLGVALFMAGYAVGPLIFAPMAEVVGNLPVMVVALAGCGVFQIPLALARNVTTILVSRFLAGMLGSGGLAVGSGLLADIFGPITRGIAVGTSASIMNLGSTISPIVGAYIVDRYDWRWTAWTSLILCGVVGLLCIALLRESSHNRLLMRRAAYLRHETGNPNYRAQAEMASLNPQVLLRKYCTKPVRMFCQEPILIVMTTYLTLVYGTLYLSYQLFPRAFRMRGWSVPTATLPFTAVGLGVLSALGVFSFFTMTWYKRRWVLAQKAAVDGVPARVPPEDRLPPMILGAVLLPPSLLWFGWSGGTHWVAQVIACFFIGLSLQLIFITGIAYIVDVYLLNTVSAISIHVMVRSLVSASFPLFEGPMYGTLHINWSATLLACLSACIMASPIIFRIHGPQIRTWSRFSVGGI